jgi:hypothetical protein
MAEGIRIVPRDDLNWPGDVHVCVTDHSRPTPQPANGQRLEDIKPRCHACGKQHFAKTYQIQMYRGSAIVSTTVWERLSALDDNPFVYANPVANPPGQLIRPDMTGGHSTELVEKFVMPITTTRSA